MSYNLELLPTIVSINPTELCNRQCVFCPRADPQVYPNRKLHMSLESAAKLGDNLRDIEFKGLIKISGFGEPMLNKKLPQIVSRLRSSAPESKIMLITSGDFLTQERCRELLDAGLSVFDISLYDGPEQVPQFETFFDEIGIDAFHLRQRWGNLEEGFGPDENFFPNNRSGLVSLYGATQSPLGRVCQIPFYKCMIDWDASVLLCDQDWGRRAVAGNLHQSKLVEIWFGETMMRYRRRLIEGNRELSPCNTCNVAGDKIGGDEFSGWRNALGKIPHELTVLDAPSQTQPQESIRAA